MVSVKTLIGKAKKYYETSYLMLEKQFMQIVEESKESVSDDVKEKEIYDIGYSKGKDKGKELAFKMKEDADGCCGCAFEDVNSWEMPCDKCKRNSRDYWRAKRVE